jgi:hypothetical protein
MQLARVRSTVVLLATSAKLPNASWDSTERVNEPFA